MANIFNGQSLLTIILDTEYDISLATEVKILYTKPDGSTGEWTGAVIDTTKISYDVLDSDINLAGEWTFQAKATIGGKIIYGTFAKQVVEDIIQVTP